ncbi:MAG: NAD(+) synthase [Desulfuromonadales bacterium]|nr:NAD(+) synthase [Desulfuromonadales bacterium]
MNEQFSKSVLDIDVVAETEKITSSLRDMLKNHVKKRGVVVGISGGIDSSVTAALAVRAIGASKVFALQMPEKHSADDTLDLSSLIISTYKMPSLHEDISKILEAVGFYSRYDEAVRTVIPQYGEDWKSKIVTSSVTENQGFSLFSIVAQSPEGETEKQTLPLKTYLSIVAATNFKQRIRKMLEYYHADRLNYAVAGTPNRLEYDQGFFVKLGDGAADIKPIAHLYKTQVYQLAEYLNVPEEIRRRPPTTDTYSLPQGQDEFYFSLPYELMDLCLFGKNHNVSTEAVAAEIGLTPEQVAHVYRDIDTKRNTTRYLHLPGLLIEKINLPTL